MQTTLKFLFHVISFVRDFWRQLDKRELSTSDERVSQNCDYISLITDLSVYLSSRWQRTAFIYFQKSSAWVRRRYCLPPNYITMECLGAKSSLEQFHLYNLIMIFSKKDKQKINDVMCCILKWSARSVCLTYKLPSMW